MVSIFKWAGLILFFSPLLPFLLLFNSGNAFQLLYVMSFRVVNRTSRTLWITPVATYDRGITGILTQFVASFPALFVFRDKNRRVRPGKAKWIYFDRKGVDHYEIVIRDSDKQYRLLPLDPIPSRENQYRKDDNQFVIESWDSLAPVTENVLAAALKPSKSWLIWGWFVFGMAMFISYCWLLGLWLGGQ